MKADKSAGGSLPTRAFQYCEPVRAASAFGWWIFLPMDLAFMWDGASRINWFRDGVTEWSELTSAQYPDFSSLFDANAPEEMSGYSPPFVTSQNDPGNLQIWTGLFVRTRPGWSLNVRGPVNTPPQSGYVVYEGIIDTDVWFGPLFVNLRLTATNSPILLKKHYPFVQVQPLPREIYSGSDVTSSTFVESVARLSPEEWEAYNRTIVLPSRDPERRRGEYAAASRKRAHGA